MISSIKASKQIKSSINNLISNTNSNKMLLLLVLTLYIVLFLIGDILNFILTYYRHFEEVWTDAGAGKLPGMTLIAYKKLPEIIGYPGTVMFYLWILMIATFIFFSILCESCQQFQKVYLQNLFSLWFLILLYILFYAWALLIPLACY